MYLSNAFDCVLHDLLITKLAAHGFDQNVLIFIYSYLNDQKQCMKIKNTKSDQLGINYRSNFIQYFLKWIFRLSTNCLPA